MVPIVGARIKFHKFPNRLSCRSERSLNETETVVLTSVTQILEVPYARTGLFLNIFKKKNAHKCLVTGLHTYSAGVMQSQCRFGI